MKYIWTKDWGNWKKGEGGGSGERNRGRRGGGKGRRGKGREGEGEGREMGSVVGGKGMGGRRSNGEGEKRGVGLLLSYLRASVSLPHNIFIGKKKHRLDGKCQHFSETKLSISEEWDLHKVTH
jgi:hypothetical protein